jgi:hypothetical protein
MSATDGSATDYSEFVAKNMVRAIQIFTSLNEERYHRLPTRHLKIWVDLEL